MAGRTDDETALLRKHDLAVKHYRQAVRDQVAAERATKAAEEELDQSAIALLAYRQGAAE